MIFKITCLVFISPGVSSSDSEGDPNKGEMNR